MEGDCDNEVCAPNTYEYLTRSKWVIVQSCLSHSEREDEKKSDYHVDSEIASYFQVETTWRLLPIEYITGRAYCVEVGNEEDKVVCLEHKREWKDKFYDFYFF